MKKAVIIILGLFLFGCVQDDELEDISSVTGVLSISYDSQDNLIKINDSEWFVSMDWGTYVDTYTWSPANEQLGVYYDSESKVLIVISSTYKITGAVIEGIYVGWDIVDGNLHIQVPDIQEYMYNTDLFYFKVKAEISKNPCVC